MMDTPCGPLNRVPMTIAVITTGGTDSSWRDRAEVRAGCGILWPIGERCFSDGARFPCEIHIWGRLTLLAHGWTCTEIDFLGAWALVVSC